MIQTIFLIACVFLLQGCVTTKKSTNYELQNLQQRISALEDEKDQKDDEIDSLRKELRQARSESNEQAKMGRTLTSAPIISSEYIVNDNVEQEQNVIKVAGVSAKQVQSALKNAGFYKGNLDGKIGPKSIEAIKAYQKENGLKSDGVIGKQTWERLKNNL